MLTLLGLPRLVASSLVSFSFVCPHTPTPEELKTLVTGTWLYRGWRLDLRSYRQPSGWRPFVLIKGPDVSLTSDSPCLLSGTFPSKAEADRHALHASKDWLDKTLWCPEAPGDVAERRRRGWGEERPTPQDDCEARRGPSRRDPMSETLD
jgi:hypothetical protein